MVCEFRKSILLAIFSFLKESNSGESILEDYLLRTNFYCRLAFALKSRLELHFTAPVS